MDGFDVVFAGDLDYAVGFEVALLGWVAADVEGVGWAYEGDVG